MATWSIPSSQEIDYSPNGDDIDSFSQKVKWSLEEIFKNLRYLHSNGATAPIGDEDGQPYELRINSTDNTLCVWDDTQKQWVALGELKEHFGIEPADIGAIENGGGINKIEMGNLTATALESLPTDSHTTNDIYFSVADNAIYRYTGTQWRVLVSLQNKGELVTDDDTAYIGSISNAGKVLRLNDNGKLNTDITGSAAKLLGKPISQTGTLADRQVLVYSSSANGGTGAFVNRNVDGIVGGGGGGGTVAADIKPLTFTQDGTTKTYDGTAALNVTLPSASANKTLTLTRGTDSLATTLGTYTGLSDRTIDITQRTLTVKQGDSVLGTYNGAEAKTISIPAVQASTNNKTLTITQGNTTLGSYDGSSVTSISIPTVQAVTENQPLFFWRDNASIGSYNGTAVKNLTLPSANQNLVFTKNSSVVGSYNGASSLNVDLSEDVSLAPLTFWNGTSSIDSYNGKVAKNINIPIDVTTYERQILNTALIMAKSCHDAYQINLKQETPDEYFHFPNTAFIKFDSSTSSSVIQSITGPVSTTEFGIETNTTDLTGKSVKIITTKRRTNADQDGAGTQVSTAVVVVNTLWWNYGASQPLQVRIAFGNAFDSYWNGTEFATSQIFFNTTFYHCSTGSNNSSGNRFHFFICDIGQRISVRGIALEITSTFQNQGTFKTFSYLYDASCLLY